MKQNLSIVLSLSFAANLAFGAVSPMIIHLKSTSSSYTTTYTVPVGTVFVLQAIQCVSATTGPFLQLVSPDGSVDDLMASSFQGIPSPLTFQPPLWIPAGYTFRAGLGGSAATTATLYGAQVLPTDLYAGIPSQFNYIAVSGSSVAGQLALSSPRPAAVHIEESCDLQTWSNSNATVTRTVAPAVWQLTKNATDATNTFFRAVVGRL